MWMFSDRLCGVTDGCWQTSLLRKDKLPLVRGRESKHDTCYQSNLGKSDEAVELGAK